MKAFSTGVRHAYVHVPFCTRRCSYCDFSIAVRREVPAGTFVQSVLAEAGIRAPSRDGQELDTLYLGGGTPSKLGPLAVADLISGLQMAGLTLAPSAEVTLEANPEDVATAAVEAWVAAGVNRLSIGIQSFAPGALSWMHRTHDAAQAAQAVRIARAAGVGNVSIDLIYALPDSISRNWDDDLDCALDLAPDHLSIYGLTVEPRTPLGRWAARGDVVPQTDDRAAEEFLMADARLRAAGYDHYEVSNYAKPGRRSRHNSAYWTRAPYVGFGPSAHSFTGGDRRWNARSLAAWEALLAAGEDPMEGAERLGDAERVAEETYLGLRTSAGLVLSSSGDVAAARRWADAGWATLEGHHVRLTAEGWLRLDALAGSLGAFLH